jgi:CRISPR/Cas system CMR-associated protein Cmr5 small subunit
LNLDQLRARHAFAFVQGIGDTEMRSKFLQIARKLPTLLQTNGLLATWAHLLAKEKAEAQAAAALLGHFRGVGLPVPAEGTPLAVLTGTWLAAGAGLSSRDLRRLTHEAIIYSAWLKRAAEALCDAGDSGDMGGSGERP